MILLVWYNYYYEYFGFVPLPLTTAHVFEEVHDANSGVQFLTSTREDWSGSSYEVHITWHLALYHLGKEKKKESLLRDSASLSMNLIF